MKSLRISTLCIFLLNQNSLSQTGQYNSYDKRPQTFEKKLPDNVECIFNYRPAPSEETPEDGHDIYDSVEEEKEHKEEDSLHAPTPSSFPLKPLGGCECVPYYLCTENRTVSQNGEGQLDIRSTFLSSVGLVSMPPYKACPCAKSSSTSKPASSSVCESYLDICCGSPPEVALPDTTRESPRCGQQTMDRLGLEVHGEADGDDQEGEFPWVVAIFGHRSVDERRGKFYLCGGSLITPYVVLTAAHCVKGKTGLMISAGAYDSHSSYNSNPTHQERIVHHVVIHEEYYAGALFNDIALLFLETAVQLTDDVALICLPEQNENMDEGNCVACGRGSSDHYENQESDESVLKKIYVPIVSRNICQDILRTTRLGKYFILHESFICAGGQAGKDTCKGDGGSPLVCPSTNNPHTYVQAGIVSWGLGCGSEIPAAYVNVANFRSWIDKKIAVLNLDDRSWIIERR